MLNFKNINNLTLTELNRVKELLTSLLEEKSINIKLFQRAENVKGYKLNNLCLMMIPSESRPKDLKYPFIEYTGKAVYLPKYMSEHINSRYCGHLFNRYFNKDINIIVQCCYNFKEIKINTFEDKMFIELGYSNLYELFLKNKELNILSKCKNTLFIFEEITWQCLQILFFTLNIRLSGGSHTKRHLISPLDIRLLDSIELLKRYVIYLKI